MELTCIHIMNLRTLKLILLASLLAPFCMTSAPFETLILDEVPPPGKARCFPIEGTESTVR
jgi:hypothetical protein